LRISLDIYRLHKKPGIKKYLKLSQQIKLEKNYDIRIFYPDISKLCPVCGKPECAIWKGYYFRGFLCVTSDGVEKTAIRKGFCNSTKTYFTCPPDIVIPYVIASKLLLIQIIKDYCFTQKIDNVISAIDIAISSLYSLMQFIVMNLRSNIFEFNLPQFSTNSVLEILKIKNFPYEKIILQPNFSWNSKVNSSGIDPPS